MRPLSRKRRKWKDELLAKYPGQVFCIGATRNVCTVRVVHAPKLREDLEFKQEEGQFFCTSRVNLQRHIYRLAFLVAHDAVWIVCAGHNKANKEKGSKKAAEERVQGLRQPRFKFF